MSRPQWTHQLRLVVALLLAGTLLLFNHRAVCCGQMVGGDEAEQLWFVERMLQALGSGDWMDLAKAFGALNHPPLRFVLSMPGLLLFPHSEFGLRLMAIVGTVVMIDQARRLGHDLGGRRTAMATLLLMAGSAVANWTSMAFGWSVAIAALIAAIRVLRRGPLELSTAVGRRAHHLVQACVAVAFLINTGAVLFFGATVLLLLLPETNRRQPGLLLRALWPWAVFYTAYYLLFFVLAPLAAARLLGIEGPFGQLAQNLGRGGQSGLNLVSLRENLMGLNAYVLPLLGWVLLLCAMVDLLRRERAVALWLAPFALAWSFWFVGGSQQYFLWVFVCLLPFGVRLLAQRLPGWAFVSALLITLLLMAGWNWVIFLRPHGSAETATIDQWLETTWSRAERRHNLVEPYAELGADLDQRLGDGERFRFDGSASFVKFYFKDDPVALYHSAYDGSLLGEQPAALDAVRGCLLPSPAWEAVVAAVTADNLCPEHVEETLGYPGSTLRLHLLTTGSAP
jgi:hypothetical protein